MYQERRWTGGQLQNGCWDPIVKNVPEPVYKAIVEEAKKAGGEADGIEPRAMLVRVMKCLERFRESLPELDDSTPLIRRDRDGG